LFLGSRCGRVPARSFVIICVSSIKRCRTH
jgi:hypothetical protein